MSIGKRAAGPFSNMEDSEKQIIQKCQEGDLEEFERLNYVRKERNKFHLQGLSIRDIGYTKMKFKKVSEPADFLSKKLLQYYRSL